MAIYTLYPSLADGSSISFVALDLAGDDQARQAAEALLPQHASAVEVVIWHGERRVGSVERLETAA